MPDLPDDDVDFLADDPHRALEAVRDASNHTIGPYSQALAIGAMNLMSKAVAADGAERERLVDRALALPFDEHDQTYPAAMAAHMQLFMAVTDRLEESDDDENDECWLDGATAVLRYSSAESRAEMHHVLEAIDHDYELDRPTRIRVRLMLENSSRSLDPGWVEITACPRDELRERVLAVLAAANDYEEAYLEARSSYDGV
ncbi:hypothetical protein V6N00_04610 [Tersicoccus sp. MR15.9]|uniref:hypothetical protein n=1 Tax=Tersicoccus mangrovi TaxID=3121635 RepID=UPI002FE6AFF1